MRHGRFITTALAAVAAMAIGPAWAAAAPSSFLDDSATEFGTGTPATDAWAIEPASATAPGSVRLRPTGATSESDTFDGTSLDATKWKATSWGAAGTGTASVAAGSLTVDGRRVNDLNDPNPAPTMVPTAGAPLTLEFRATFGAEIFQNVGFGNTFDTGPWAMFSTGDDSGYRPLGLYARTLDTGGFSTDTPISGVVPTDPHVYRIEWSTSDVKFYVDGVPVATNPVTPPVITTAMRPVVSDVTLGASPTKTVKVDWLGMGSFASSGTFTSQVHDAGDNRAVWGALTQAAVAPTGTAVTIKSRSGKTSTPDNSWSDYQPLGGGGAIQSPVGRYIQYQATLTTTDIHVTPSLDSVQIGYDIDTTPPSATVNPVEVSGTNASASFSSPNNDIAGFECSLDNGAFAACTSPKQLTGLAPGSHTLSVRGIDKAGNTGTAVSRTFSIASPQSGGTGTPSGGSSSADRIAPNVSVVAKSLRASKRGTIAFRVRCPAGERRCKVTLQLKRGGSVAASKTVTVAGGKTVTVTLQLTKAIRKQLHSHGSLKVTAVTTARDAAGNKKTAKQSMTLRAP